MKSKKYMVFAIISFALAMSNLVLWVAPVFGIALAIVAIIFACIGLKAESKKGFAVAGLIVGIFTLVVSIAFTGFFLGSFVTSVKKVSKKEAEKKASNVYYAGKNVLLECSVYGADYEMVYDCVKYDGITYSVTAKDLKSIGEIDKNPFTSTTSDGGMTITYNTSTFKFSCTVTGTIDGCEILFDPTDQTFTAE